MTKDLVLYGERGWVSPWVFHAMVALEEKGLPYRLELPPLPLPDDVRAHLRALTGVGKVPVLVHGDVAIGESLAISEYLAETFPTPGHPRIFPADLGERAHARTIMSFLRTSLFALREHRPTSTVFGAPTDAPLPADAQAQADDLLRVAAHAVGARASIASAWCIADADLALALMRLVANGDPVPEPLRAYARSTWERPSVQVYLRHAAEARAS
ncbi:MAG TPA: glutathione transferase [Kofleriaceae bacterium]|nr:glutathione transferase [Kofleriaceae bacterium]